MIFCAETSTPKSNEKRAALQDKNIPVIALPNSKGKVDLPKVFEYLAKEFSANEVHVEAGFKLNGSLIREQCVDELLLYMAPTLFGLGQGLANLGPFESLSEGPTWKLLDHQKIGEDLRLRLLREN